MLILNVQVPTKPWGVISCLIYRKSPHGGMARVPHSAWTPHDINMTSATLVFGLLCPGWAKLDSTLSLGPAHTTMLFTTWWNSQKLFCVTRWRALSFMRILLLKKIQVVLFWRTTQIEFRESERMNREYCIENKFANVDHTSWCTYDKGQLNSACLKFRMNLWGHRFSQTANQKFLPWKFIRE